MFDNNNPHIQPLADVPLGQPRIRWWEISNDSPGYYKSLAAPSQDELVWMWWILSFVNLIDSIVVAIVFLSIVFAKRPTTRKNPFNIYLLFLMFPDFLYSFLCFLTCLLCAIKGEYWSPTMCQWQAIYLICATSANSWINALTTMEIHVLLRKSNRRERYFPPTIKQVTIRSMSVYVYSFLLSIWILIDGPWGIHTVDALYGFVCLPVQFTTGSNLFWYLVFVPLFMGIPLLYICYVLYDIYKHKLLPPAGKRRELTIYFFRLTFIFIAFWIPTILVYYIFRGLHPWGMFIFGVWTHSAGGVCAFFTTYKPDVGEAVSDLFDRIFECFIKICPCLSFCCCKKLCRRRSSNSLATEQDYDEDEDHNDVDACDHDHNQHHHHNNNNNGQHDDGSSDNFGIYGFRGGSRDSNISTMMAFPSSTALFASSSMAFSAPRSSTDELMVVEEGEPGEETTTEAEEEEEDVEMVIVATTEKEVQGNVETGGELCHKDDDNVQDPKTLLPCPSEKEESEDVKSTANG